MSDAYRQIVECSIRQQGPGTFFLGAPPEPIEHDDHPEVERDVRPSAQTPNLLIWTGVIHRHALELR